MKIVITNDIHFQNQHMFAKPSVDGLTTWALMIFKYITWLKEYVKIHKIKMVLIPGDLFTAKSAIPTPLYVRALDELGYLATFAKIVAIPGNHDLYAKTQSPKIHTLYALHHAKVLHALMTSGERYTVTETGSVSASGSGERGATIAIFGVPAGCKRYPELDLRKTDTHRIFMIHENIIDALYPNKQTAKKGLDLTELKKYLQANEIDACFCGDIHAPQWLNVHGEFKEAVWNKSIHVTTGAVYLPGAPYQKDFGECDQRRGFMVYDTKENTVAWIDYPDGPRFTTIDDAGFKAWTNHLDIHDPKNFYRLALGDQKNLDFLRARKLNRFANVKIEPVDLEIEKDETPATSLPDQDELIDDFTRRKMNVKDKTVVTAAATLGKKLYGDAQETRR